MSETRSEKFRRIAEFRVNRISNNLHLIKNLSNRKHYEYDKELIEYYLNFIISSLQKVSDVFKNNLYGKDNCKIAEFPEIEKIETETKKQRSERVLVKRINGIIRELNLLINLSNRKNYTYKDEEVDRIIEYLLFNFTILKYVFLFKSRDEFKW